jgi:glycosyltransferase involved in cell wall biosynthesis
MFSTISIAAPAYNEGETIYPLVKGWAAYLETRFSPDNYEIVVCDDGSRDETGALLEKLARESAAIRPCRHAINEGAAAALSTAIQYTTKDWVLLLDADGQYPIENLGLFLNEGARVPSRAFIGFRRQKVDSAFARFGSWISGACCNLFHRTAYRDFNCALKMVEGPLLRGLCLEAKGLNYSTEISSKILEQGVAMTEVEVLHHPRAAGCSTRTFWRGTWHRMLFVFYIGTRQLLLRLGILRRQNTSP